MNVSMCTKMPESINEERLRWILPIYHKQVTINDVIKVCPHGKRTIERWLESYRKGGEAALEPKSTRPKTHPNETPIRIKEQIKEERRQTKLCALKLSWRLEKKGIVIHHRTIGKILKEDNLVRKYRIRKPSLKKSKALLKPGELIEIGYRTIKLCNE